VTAIEIRTGLIEAARTALTAALVAGGADPTLAAGFAAVRVHVGTLTRTGTVYLRAGEQITDAGPEQIAAFARELQEANPALAPAFAPPVAPAPRPTNAAIATVATAF
jgi:hypothetical protein